MKITQHSSGQSRASAAVKIAALVLPLSVVMAGSSVAASAPVKEQQSIPFVDHGGIYSWTADRDKGVWIQDSHRRWFYASVMGPCPGLDFANRIGFDARPMGTLDRFSALIVPGWGRCQLQSLVPSDGPPKKVKGQPKAPAAEPAATDDKRTA